jgi:hypothetical protein
MANVARRSSASNERTPLIGHNAAAAAEQEQAEANNSAFFSGIALNPDASSFSRAPGIEEDDEDEETPVPSAVAQAEPPRRADLYVVLTGMWIGTFLAVSSYQPIVKEIEVLNAFPNLQALDGTIGETAPARRL